MPRALFVTLVGVVLAMSVAASSSGAASGASAPAQAECAKVTEGSSAGDEEACTQGYDGAKAAKSVQQSCDPLGSGTVTDTEDVKDCLAGWSLADIAGTTAAGTPSAAAQTECAKVTEGSSAGDEEACAQGYDGAKAAKSVEQSCDSVGSGAVTDTEDVKDCEVGWSVS